ncbi:hypothetical protein IGI37_003723 [Enterococcus sp. AZ194]|uniref:hypothetical protein n=1 Tax=Enterococcus sp. AZ194 TaxID=2774629 RepID=UPI003F221612
MSNENKICETDELIVTYTLTEDDYFVFNRFIFNQMQSWKQKWWKRILYSLSFPIVFLLIISVYELFFSKTAVDYSLLLGLTLGIFIILFLIYPKMVDSTIKKVIKKHPELLDSTGCPYDLKQLRLKDTSVIIFDGVTDVEYNLSQGYNIYLKKDRLFLQISEKAWEIIPLNQLLKNDVHKITSFVERHARQYIR